MLPHHRPKIRAGISDETILELTNACRQCKSGAFVDLGTGEGMSLEVIKDAAPPGASIWTVDDDTKFTEEVRTRLKNAGQDLKNVEFIHAPLEECFIEGIRQKWYQAKALERIAGPIGLLFIDGPIGTVGRFPAIPFFRARLAPKAIALLDDCRRPEEQKIFEKWKQYLKANNVPHRADILMTDRGLGRIFFGPPS